MKNKARKPSWLYLDLAFKIQVPPRHYAAKLVLLLLAKSANDAGKSYHGYRSISAHLQLGHSAIHTALCCLRDELGILTWEQGSGGFQKKDTNDYQLDLQAMTALVTAQGIFNSDGRLIRSATCAQQPGQPEGGQCHSAESTTAELDSSHFHSVDKSEAKSVPLSGTSVVSTECAVVSTERKVVSTEAQSPLRSAEHNPQKSNPQIEQPTKATLTPALFFSGECSEQASLQTVNPESEADRLPPVPPTPQAGAVQTTFGDPLPGFQFRCGEDPSYWHVATGRRFSFEEATRVAAQAEER